MKTEVNPKETTRAYAFEMWMNAPMPMVTFIKTLDVTRLRKAARRRGMKFNMLMCWCIGRAASAVKEFYTLPPETVRELADQFLHYFQPSKRRVLMLFYDRAMNNYHKVKNDMASAIKNAIEFDASGKRTGWRVQLMSLGQGNIGSNLEYLYMQDLLSGNLEQRLFSLQIDQYNCPCLKAEMEVCRTKVKDDGDRRMVVKEKKGDKLSRERLPKESTNLTDALKYLMCRREFLDAWRRKGFRTA